ncbi:MAG TPA: acyltransferase [Verrucomicrobiae bacterium]|nr:acyltransferase [Verrucomicrobiae bacterium]
MILNFLRRVHGAWLFFLSGLRLLLPRCLGLRTGCDVRVGQGIEWPLGNLQNLELGNNVRLGKRGWFYLPLNNRKAKIHIGSGTEIGNEFVIASHDSVRIGSACLISFRVTIMDQTHATGWGVNPVTSGITTPLPVKISDRCYIGCGVVIMAGVELGTNCIVGANSVVTRSFPDGAVISGSPARLLRLLAKQ